MNYTRGEKIFKIFNAIVLTILSCMCIYPLLYVLSASFSSPDAVAAGKVWLLPKGLSVAAYKNVLGYNKIWTAYLNTVFYAVVGTLVSMVVTICGAYPLSKKRLHGSKIIVFLISFSMWFTAGIIPTYLNFRDLGLLDTRTSLIFGFCVTTFYVFIMRTFFSGIPESLEEAAKIDGANDLYILIRIYLPLSLPCIATLSLYYLVDRWNAYFWAMILLKDESKIPLQVILNKLIVQANWSSDAAGVDTSGFSKETLIYSTIVVSVIPMLAAYPFIQKYFVKGIMVGAVKG